MDIPWPAPHDMAGSVEIKSYGVALIIMLQRLLTEGKIKPHPRREIKGDFTDVLKWLDIAKSGKVRGEKLVYTLV